MEPKGTGTIEYLPELRRIPLLGTSVNRPLPDSVNGIGRARELEMSEERDLRRRV
jgi:hypothetical protein